MNSINDVDCKYLANLYDTCVELTEDVKQRWNTMTVQERKGFKTTKPCYFKPYARDVLENIYQDFEEWEGIEDGALRLWNDTPSDFVTRFQELLDEISEFPSSEYFIIYMDIDPTIDLKEV